MRILNIHSSQLLLNRHVVILGIFFVGLLLRGYQLSAQPPLDDEVAVAFDAVSYMDNGRWSRIMWEHPPLRNIVVFLSGKLFGEYDAWGLRFGSVLFGSLTILALGYLSYSLFNSKLVMYLSAGFLCIDPLHISLSREAFQETTTAFFIVIGVLSAYHAMKRDRLILSAVSGVFFGAASASKWHGIFPLLASALAYLIYPWMTERHPERRPLSARFLTVFSCYIVIPITIYSIVHLPWLRRGYSLGEFVDFQFFLVWAHYFHRASDYAETFLTHRAYLWFVSPVAWNDFVFSNGKPYLNVAMGNFFVWVLTLPAVFLCFRTWINNKRFELGYVLLLFFISYLPLVLTSRGIWVFNALAVIPFAFIISSYMLFDLIDKGQITYRMLYSYLGIIIAIAGLMYPLSTFRALEYPVYKPFIELYSPHGRDGR